MNELDEKIINLLIAKVDSGEEKNLPFDVRKLKNIEYFWTLEDDTPLLPDNITKNVSDKTLKELLAFFRE